MTSPRFSPAGADPAAGSGANGRVAGRYSQDGYTIVWVQGEIDLATVPALFKELADSVQAEQCRVIVDLTDVTFMDSTGLNALAVAWRSAEARAGEVRLVGVSSTIRRVLQVTGLEQFFPIHSTIEESIDSGRGSPPNRTVLQFPNEHEFQG